MVLKYNGSILKVNHGASTLGYSGFVPYDYMTFKAGSGSYSIIADPVNWTPKVWTNSYLYDLTSGTQASLSASGSDAFYMSYGNSHVYRAEWTEADINSTKNNSQQYWNQYPIFYGSEKFNGIVELYSIDFWHKPLWNNTGFPDVTIIPQDARNIHRGAELTDCSNLFKNAPITNSIEKFILAMQTACPNLTTTSGCFAGCTTAPDYAYCLSNYPNWF